MGIELLILAVFIVQVAAALLLAVKNAFSHRWFALLGMILGIGLLFLPYWIFSAPTASGLWFLFALIGPFILAAYYCFRLRWKSFGVALLIAISVSYIFFLRNSWFAKYISVFATTLGLIGELALLCTPILCVLTVSLSVGEFDRFFIPVDQRTAR